MKRPFKERKSRHRRGVTAVLIAALLFVFIVTTALTVDVSYMQLVRTELRAATDSAAKAASEALSRTESKQEAILAAKKYASLNKVGGVPFLISDTDVQFGRVTRDAAGKFQFQQNATPENAVHIVGRLANDALTKPARLFFARALGHGDFSTSQTATASQQDVEVCLALDRSGSMLFDMSGTDYEYPPNNPNLSTFTAWGTLWQNHLSPPNPVGSRWAVLADAVDVFLEEAGRYTQPPRVGLVTWGSDYTMPIAPGTFYPATQVDVAIPAAANHNGNQSSLAITQAIATRSSQPMMGGTDMGAGIDAAVTQLTTASGSSLSNKVVILLSDGVWNGATDPLTAAQTARNNGIVIHTISMLSTDQATLRDVAAITGGRFYPTSNQAELRTAFAELARTLPVVLTD